MRPVFLFLFFTGCAIDHTGLVGSDAVDVDAAPVDAAPVDAAPLDTLAADDVVSFDGGVRDGAVSRDTGAPDAASDAGRPDGGLRDAGNDAHDAGNDVDPCSVGPDSDSDGVVDACDACRGFDDGDDFDSDGIADGCDDWSCGTRPTVPETIEAEEIRVNGVNIHGMGNAAVVRPDERFEIVFDWFVGDEGCPTCIRQVEWGFSRVGRRGCVYDANPPSSGASGQANIPNISFPPVAEGVYELRFNLGQEYRCSDIENWHDAAPGAGQTFGVVCVLPADIASP